MKYRLLHLLFLFVILPSLAQDSTSTYKPEKRWDMFKYDMGNLFKSVGHSYTRPLHWKGKEWKQFGGVVSGTGLIYIFDDDTSEFIRRQKESVPEVIRNYGSFYGSPENNYLVTSGVYTVGLITKNEKLRRTGVLLMASATSAGLLQHLMKSAVGRARPAAALGKSTFDPFNSNRNYHSFPSGHTLLAFTNAYAIGKQFKSPWIKAGIYTIGAIPGLSRIWDGQHWLTDFAFAIVISVATVESIDRYLDKKYDEKYNAQNKQLSWDLNFGPGSLGLVVQF